MLFISLTLIDCSGILIFQEENILGIENINIYLG